MAGIHRLDAVAHGECHGARTTANVMESFVCLVQKKDRPYFKAILDYIRTNTLQWVQDEGYSSDFMFRNHKRKGRSLVSVEAYIPAPRRGVPEVQKPPRQKGKLSPAILERTA